MGARSAPRRRTTVAARVPCRASSSPSSPARSCRCGARRRRPRSRPLRGPWRSRRAPTGSRSRTATARTPTSSAVGCLASPTASVRWSGSPTSALTRQCMLPSSWRSPPRTCRERSAPPPSRPRAPRPPRRRHSPRRRPRPPATARAPRLCWPSRRTAPPPGWRTWATPASSISAAPRGVLWRSPRGRASRSTPSIVPTSSAACQRSWPGAWSTGTRPPIAASTSSRCSPGICSSCTPTASPTTLTGTRSRTSSTRPWRHPEARWPRSRWPRPWPLRPTSARWIQPPTRRSSAPRAGTASTCLAARRTTSRWSRLGLSRRRAHPAPAT
mmetsp:Transcript_18302/g.49105  ORF Transcript_18302/g.49105 Transcript_18302/m.49105 type:complete len:328 (-) Transcript_18302:497-1480(-)